MVRSSIRPVLSLCLIVLAGYGAYVPFEKVRSAQIEAASQSTAFNALLPELQSRAVDGKSAPVAKNTVSLALEGERAIDKTDFLSTDLNDKTL